MEAVKMQDFQIMVDKETEMVIEISNRILAMSLITMLSLWTGLKWFAEIWIILARPVTCQMTSRIGQLKVSGLRRPMVRVSAENPCFNLEFLFKCSGHPKKVLIQEIVPKMSFGLKIFIIDRSKRLKIFKENGLICSAIEKFVTHIVAENITLTLSRNRTLIYIWSHSICLAQWVQVE